MTEVFRRFNERLEVSDLGNVKKDGKLVEPGHGENYDYVCCNGMQYRVHIMVAAMFPEICGEKKPYYHAHHINRNQRDNRAVNLVWLSRSEHKRIHQLEDGVAKAVAAYKLDGEKVGEWESLMDAERATGALQTHIGRCCRGERYTAGGYVWVLSDATEEELQEKLRKANGNDYLFRYSNDEHLTKREYRKKENKSKIEEKKKIYQYDNGKFVKEWCSVQEAADYYGVTKNAITANLSGKTEYFKRGGKKCYFLKYFMPN